jgi:hypothetical protein
VTTAVPAPYASTGSAASAAIAYSSRSPRRRCGVSTAPSESSSCARLRGQHRQVTGVDPDRAEGGPATAIALRMPWVMSYVSDQQRGLLAQRGDLRGERGRLVVVQQGERVGGGTVVGTP